MFSLRSTDFACLKHCYIFIIVHYNLTSLILSNYYNIYYDKLKVQKDRSDYYLLYLAKIILLRLHYF